MKRFLLWMFVSLNIALALKLGDDIVDDALTSSDQLWTHGLNLFVVIMGTYAAVKLFERYLK